MIKTALSLALTLLTFGYCDVVNGQDKCSWTNEGTWVRYKAAKLSGVIKGHTRPGMDNAQGVDIGNDPVKARVIFTGESRPTSERTKGFISF